jgi:hypothetical protein
LRNRGGIRRELQLYRSDRESIDLFSADERLVRAASSPRELPYAVAVQAWR